PVAPLNRACPALSARAWHAAFSSAAPWDAASASRHASWVSLRAPAAPRKPVFARASAEPRPRTPSRGTRRQAARPRASASFAEELDHVCGARARLAEGDPAVPAKSELLAPQDDFLVALDSDEGAVRAVVGEDELVQ